MLRSMSRRSGAALLAGGALALAAAAFASPVGAVDPNAPNQLALDAVPGPAVDGELTIAPNTPFNLTINVTRSAGPYKGYQWLLSFPDGDIDLAGAPQENTAATGLDVCEEGVVAPDTGNVTVIGQGAGCISLDEGAGTTYVGPTTTIRMQCLREGSFDVRLLDRDADALFGASLMDSTGAELVTSTTSVKINCSNAAPAATPAAQATSVPGAAVPPGTDGGTAPGGAPPSTSGGTSGGSSGSSGGQTGTVNLPDTGYGTRDSTRWPVVLAMLLLAGGLTAIAAARSAIRINRDR